MPTFKTNVDIDEAEMKKNAEAAHDLIMNHDIETITAEEPGRYVGLERDDLDVQKWQEGWTYLWGVNVALPNRIFDLSLPPEMLMEKAIRARLSLPLICGLVECINEYRKENDWKVMVTEEAFINGCLLLINGTEEEPKTALLKKGKKQ